MRTDGVENVPPPLMANETPTEAASTPLLRSGAAKGHGIGVSAPTEENKPSPLLELPAELMNRIYEATLIAEESIWVKGRYTSPGLVAVNRQIRHEARTTSPWFATTSIQDGFTASSEATLHQMYLNDGLDLSVTTLRMDWNNLREWLQNFHELGILRLHPIQHADVDNSIVFYFFEDPEKVRRRKWNIVARSFDLVESMCDKLPWTDVLELLETYKVSVEGRAGADWT
ncbi:hypothetical protein CLAFUW4_09493 [Fulvia fulva]|uniref:Uncharacterized protein n=1 Tax=Passalora fulva TaxID=5499 RepID=A0A9Q8PFW7_PASFU|nr:uncharacterized protein CLAFUR5_09590 [Fulvia fulva]KAK4613352.1 hypothetical protein CLAFUR4_09499 [Fulvia fulva]UJO21667.1 hypothetical protein CLAFUR5_09590 [Fulvia fulva]WPV20134.1 hypothetical protein CLAFUW4_09493 [Fulvia fulva]WPV35234.1 hypothetical protein CLAFUW7_09494 [Fulvia fulva]